MTRICMVFLGEAMIRKRILLLLIVGLNYSAFGATKSVYRLDSPNGKCLVEIFQEDGFLNYQVSYDRIKTIKPSKLGIEFKENVFFKDLKVVGSV